MSNVNSVKRWTILGGVGGVACTLVLPGMMRRATAAKPAFHPLVCETPAGEQYGGRYVGCLECADQAGNIFFTKGYPGVIRLKVERSGTWTGQWGSPASRSRSGRRRLSVPKCHPSSPAP